MSAGSSSGSSSSRAAAVVLLLCLAANSVSGSTDAADKADLFGIGILIQRSTPPRTVVRLPLLTSSTGSKTAAAAPGLATPPAGESLAAPATVAVAVPLAAGSVTTTTVTTVTTTTKGVVEQPAALPVTGTVSASTPAATPARTATAVATAGPPASSASAFPVLKPAFSQLPFLPSQQQPGSAVAQQAVPQTPAAGSPDGMVSVIQPILAAPPAAGSSSSTQLLPIPFLMAGPTVKAPPPFVFTQKDAKQTILIGCSVPFEGSQQLVGQAVFSALQMAVTQIVPKELPDVNVNITCINSKCEDIPAHMAVSKFAAEGAIGVIGDICSRASVAAAGVANMRKMPVISPASTSPSLSLTDYFYRTVPSDTYQGMADANLVRKSGANTTAIVYEDSAYGYGLAINFIAGFTKERGSVPVVYQFKAGKGDPKAAVAEVVTGVQSKGVQALFMSTSNLTFAADFLVAAKAANLSLPIFAGDSLSDQMLYDQVAGRPSLIDKVTSTSVAPGSKDFVRAFTNFTGGNASTSYQAYAAHAYDAVTALLRAYKAAAAPKDGPAITAQLNKLDVAGVGGRVKFDVYGDLVPDNQTYAAVKFNTTSGGRMVQGFVSS